MALVWCIICITSQELTCFMFGLKNMCASFDECVREGTSVSVYLSSNEHAGICVTQALIGRLPVCFLKSQYEGGN
jgi:hypothetical protein